MLTKVTAMQTRKKVVLRLAMPRRQWRRPTKPLTKITYPLNILYTIARHNALPEQFTFRGERSVKHTNPINGIIE